jgi:hypothetical protein
MNEDPQAQKRAELEAKIRQLSNDQLTTLFSALGRQSSEVSEEMKLVIAELAARMKAKSGM